MQTISSPGKRRAVLGSLDANAAMSTPAKKVVAREGPPLVVLTPSIVLASSSPDVESEAGKGRKRVAEDEGEEEVADESPAAKKACVDGSTRSSSPSVETSSVFDASTMTTTTTATEPVIPTTRPSALTREQAREKAEILRLRLGLAGYKVRTGQTSVPLAELQRRPLPPPSTNTMRRRANTCTSTERGASTHTRVRSVDSFTHVPGLSQGSSTLSTASDAIVTVVASQESVVVETRGNTPGGDAAPGGERDSKGGLLLKMGDVDSPSSMFQSSPVPAPVSSLRSTCA